MSGGPVSRTALAARAFSWTGFDLPGQQGLNGKAGIPQQPKRHQPPHMDTAGMPHGRQEHILARLL